MEKQDFIYTLREIADWVDSDKSKVKIPDLQRGLVWKAGQMELLWDSMLRGFPIGSFILSDASDGTYFLMDGQQRFNAIATGFGTTGQENARLWLDIRPLGAKSSTRAYWVKATTKAHPWGFNNDDACTTLTSQERRDALEKYGMKDKRIYRDAISLAATWPFKAGKPIPLIFFLEAPLDKVDSFKESIVTRCQKMKGFPCSQLDGEDIQLIEGYYNTFKELGLYTIQCDVLPGKVVERESSERKDTDGMTPLEVLFNRLNTGGTRISPDDLNYSAIKAYWGGIRDINDQVAERCMPPAKLAMLTFRLNQTLNNPSEGLANPLSIKKIRSLANDSKTKDSILKTYDRLNAIIERIDALLEVYDQNEQTDWNGMPAFIRTSIARNSPDVFLLLMYLASEDIDQKMAITREEAKGLTLLLHWLGLDRKTAADVMFRHLANGGGSVALRRGLSECFGLNLILPVYSPEMMREIIQVKPDSEWTPWAGKDYAPWHDFYSRISWWGYSEAQEMLLYAQQRFINKQFSRYDPAREDMWEKHNRPWDYDHIIPRNWIKEKGRRRTTFKDYCDHWVDRIGNIGAIPFEDNRSKGDRESYDVYDKNQDSLLFDQEFIKLFSLKESLPTDADGSYRFAQLVFDRNMKIYESCYQLFAPLLATTTLTERQLMRQRLMKEVASGLNSAETVFVARGGILWRDYPVTQDAADWSREWISVGVRRKDKYFVCFTWGCNKEDNLIIGVRKLPGTDIEKDTSDLPQLDPAIYRKWASEWWYQARDIHEDAYKTNPDMIISEMTEILSKFDLNE